MTTATTPIPSQETPAEAIEPRAPVLGLASGSPDFDMMTEWATSLQSRLPTIDLRHATIALEWFSSYARSHIKRAEELRAIEAVGLLANT